MGRETVNLERRAWASLIELALAEDLLGGDVTSAATVATTLTITFKWPGDA